MRDIETIETELIFADLEQAERRLERVVRTARGGDKAAIAEEALADARSSRNCRPAGRRAGCRRPMRVDKGADRPPADAKPVLFVANVDEGVQEVPDEVAAHAAANGAVAVAVSSRLEAELSELDDEDAATMRGEMGGSNPACSSVVTGAFALLDLIAFFTAGAGKRAQSWHLRARAHGLARRGRDPLRHPAGLRPRRGHRAGTKLIEAGGYSQARDLGTLRLEGRDYVMPDGDVITVKFTP